MHSDTVPISGPLMTLRRGAALGCLMATFVGLFACQPSGKSSTAPAADGEPLGPAPSPSGVPPVAPSAPSQALSERDPQDPPEARELREQLVGAIAREGDARDSAVLGALRRVPRHLFTPGVSLSLAYGDHPLAIGHGQTISQPTVVAIMTEALALTRRERVLEIGTGSGYQAAVLSVLAAEVYSIEIVPELGEIAGKRLRQYGYQNVQVRVGDGYLGWPEQAPFDRIIVTAAPPEVPKALLDQLKEGGRLVAPVGEQSGEQTLYRYEKQHGRVQKESLGLVRFVPMVRGN